MAGCVELDDDLVFPSNVQFTSTRTTIERLLIHDKAENEVVDYVQENGLDIDAYQKSSVSSLVDCSQLDKQAKINGIENEKDDALKIDFEENCFEVENKLKKCSTSGIKVWRPTKKPRGVKVAKKRKYYCKCCGIEFSTEGRLNYHNKTRCGKKNFECTICHKMLSTVYLLNYHMRIHTGETPFACVLCGERFRFSSSYNIHMLKHTGKRPFVCELCGKDYIHQKSWMYHMKTHTDKMRYNGQLMPHSCALCSKSYIRKASLITHQNKCHPPHLKNNMLRQNDGDTDTDALHVSGLNESNVEQNRSESENNAETSFLCGTCPENFPTIEELREHTNTHTGDRPFQCEHCGAKFSRWMPYDDHRRTHTKERPFKCTACDRSYSSRAALKQHLKYHKPRSLSGPVCDQKFLVKTEFNMHLRTDKRTKAEEIHMPQHRPDGSIENCMDMREAAESETHFGLDEFWQDVADDVDFSEASNLIEIDEGDNLSITSLQNEGIENELNSFEELFSIGDEVKLNLMANVLDETASALSDDEENQLNDKFDYDTQVSKSWQNIPKMEYECDDCGKKFRSESGLKSHKYSQCGKKTFLCSMCPKSFSTSGRLASHIRTHTGERPYECKCCDKRFAHRSALNLHINRHTGDRPYKCKICDKTFAQHATMRTHMRMSHAPRKFACAACDKKYARIYDLNIHMRSHTGEKPYSCKYCTKSYMQRGTLNTHINNCHPDNLIEFKAKGD